MELGQQSGFHLTLPGAALPSAPLVVILGWYGAQDRHVAKYSALLEKQGYPSVRGVLPGAAVFSPIAMPRRRFAARLLDFIAAVDPQGSRPLVFYAFSNGGAFVLQQLDVLLHGDPRYALLSTRVAGCIFDSAPCYMHGHTGATAIGQGLHPLLRMLLAALFYLSVLLSMVLSPRWAQRFWHSMECLRLGPRCSRFLVLYSVDDPLCDAAKLDGLVASWRQRGGADVAAVRWDRSQHVAHLRQHMQEYTAALLGFLKGIQ